MEDRLRKLVGVADAGSFVRAAQELYVSQPALSVAIAKLERELHAPLYVRGVRPFTLTPAGELAYRAGLDIGTRTDSLRTLVAEQARRKVAVSLGMIDSVASALFAAPGSIDTLERHASVSLVVDNSRNLQRLVESGKLDAAFVTGQDQYPGSLEVLHRATEPLAVVCLAAQQSVLRRALRAGRLPRFISYDQASSTQRLVLDALDDAGLRPQTPFYSTSPEVMLHLVRLGRGVAALPYQQVRELVAAGELALLHVPAGRNPLVIARPIHVIRRRAAALPAALERTLGRVSNQIDALYADLHPHI